MNVLLISTYELGRQPFGLASPAAWLVRDGHSVTCADLAVAPLGESALRSADLIAFYLPMHTAARLAIPVIERARAANPRARLAAYGLYAPLNRDLLRSLGVEGIIGGEFESGLVQLARGETPPEVSLERQTFLTPDRAGLPDLSVYAKLAVNGHQKLVAYTEASRGCKHVCRHCPITPVYQGRFRVVSRDVVLADVRNQVAAGASHVTFGDPDFLNGPKHAIDIVAALHAEFPALTYDATIKIEHLKQHRDLLPRLKETGCILVTSAVESLDDRVLELLEKGHTRQDFIETAVYMRELSLTLSPTFIAFTPWTTLDSYRDLLRTISSLGLIEHVAPIQLALRLLVTQGSRLLELADFKPLLGPFDFRAMVYPWQHPDSEIDRLADRVFRLVHELQTTGRARAEIFRAICRLVQIELPPENFNLLPHSAIPYLDEPWYC